MHFNCAESSIIYAKKVANITRKKDNTIHREKRAAESRVCRNAKQLTQRYRNLLCWQSSFKEYYSRTHGYSSHGERIYGEVPAARFGRTSVVGAINQNNDFFAGFAFKGYMNLDLFCGWLEYIYAPTLSNPQKSVLFIDSVYAN